MLDLGKIDLGLIADALADQSTYDNRSGVDPSSGKVVFWTRDLGIDGRTPVDREDLDMVWIDPLPSYVWHQDMSEFAALLSDQEARRRLDRAIDGRGAFRRFRTELQEEYPDLLPIWYAFRDARAHRRAVEWLADNSLIDEDTAARFYSDHPDPSPGFH